MSNITFHCLMVLSVLCSPYIFHVRFLHAITLLFLFVIYLKIKDPSDSALCFSFGCCQNTALSGTHQTCFQCQWNPRAAIVHCTISKSLKSQLLFMSDLKTQYRFLNLWNFKMLKSSLQWTIHVPYIVLGRQIKVC